MKAYIWVSRGGMVELLIPFHFQGILVVENFMRKFVGKYIRNHSWHPVLKLCLGKRRKYPTLLRINELKYYDHLLTIMPYCAYEKLYLNSNDHVRCLRYIDIPEKVFYCISEEYSDIDIGRENFDYSIFWKIYYNTYTSKNLISEDNN